ncbi:hypothetical protein [Streptomyces malaysiensis]|uniref:hypothetical protein n=1 Tax=Streptomyces malaysiensis TaxID=92644 RepID=UPI0011CD9E1B|nr:hypothetical protein [Streptomyces malaysiensis]
MEGETATAVLGAGVGIFTIAGALVGARLQARAAQRAAEVSAQAIHDQDRRTARRDAVVTFVLAVERVRDEALRLHEGMEGPFQMRLVKVDGDTDMARGLTVVRIEGPEEIAVKATEVNDALGKLVSRAVTMHRIHASYQLLRELRQDNPPLDTAMRRLARLRNHDDPAWSQAWSEVWAAIRDTRTLDLGELWTLRDHWHPSPGRGLAYRPLGQERQALRTALDALIGEYRGFL